MENVKAIDHGSVRLWRLFHNKLTQLGVDPKNVGWLVKWGEGFAKSMKGPLASRSASKETRDTPHISWDVVA
jgi:hypothetical protein